MGEIERAIGSAFGSMAEIGEIVKNVSVERHVDEVLGELGARIAEELVEWNESGIRSVRPHEAEWVSKKVYDAVVEEIAGAVMRNVNEGLGLEGLPYGIG